jgi:predicted phosphate transport protein (TIGR00153 family)
MAPVTDRIHSLMIAHSQKVSMAVHALKGGAEAWREGDIETLEKLVGELGGLEEEADALRRKITRELARSGLPHATTELFRRLSHQTDDVADTAQRAGNFLLVIREVLLPPRYKGDIVKMASICQTAMATLAEAIHCLREPVERRVEYAARISDLERSVDDIEFKVQQQAVELQLDTWSTIIFWRLTLTISRVADFIEDAADELLSYEAAP